jgi:hypothetical protein
MSNDDIPEPDEFSEEEELDSDFKDMEGNNGREEERELPLQYNQPWLDGNIVAILG